MFEIVMNSNDQSSDDVQSDNINGNECKLRLWTLQRRIKRSALTELLNILRSFGLNWHPMDSRTFLKTPQKVDINDVAGGKMWYQGIATNVSKVFNNLRSDISVSLNFNIDGMALYSSKKQIWPILVNVHEYPYIKPMAIAIWCGNSKPNDVNEFLNRFVIELNQILRNGINVNQHLIKIMVRCFLCDAPARALIKGS